MSRQEEYNSAVTARAHQIMSVMAEKTKTMWGAHAIMDQEGDAGRASELIFAVLGKEAKDTNATVGGE